MELLGKQCRVYPNQASNADYREFCDMSAYPCFRYAKQGSGLFDSYEMGFGWPHCPMMGLWYLICTDDFGCCTLGAGKGSTDMNIAPIVKQLQKEKQKILAETVGIDDAIEVLSSINGHRRYAKKRHVSAQSRHRMSIAQRKRRKNAAV